MNKKFRVDETFFVVLQQHPNKLDSPNQQKVIDIPKEDCVSLKYSNLEKEFDSKQTNIDVFTIETDI